MALVTEHTDRDDPLGPPSWTLSLVLHASGSASSLALTGRSGHHRVTSIFFAPFRFPRGHSPTVVLGAHSLSKNEPMKQTFEIKKFIPFSRLQSGSASHDIMLIKVGRFAAFRPFDILTQDGSVN